MEDFNKVAMDVQRRKENVAILSIVSNTILIALKIIVGIAIGSVAIISEAIHSGVDLLAAIIALYSVRTSSIPPDRTHPFGHGKVENISGTVEALLIFLAAGWIIWEAVQKIRNPEHLEGLGWGVGIMLVSAAANFYVSEKLFRVGRETDSIALQADGWHLRTDVYTSVGVMLGLACIWIAAWLSPGLNLLWLDPLAAIVVAVLIIKAAYDLTMQSARDLLDVGLPKEEEEWIRQSILQYRSVVHGFHQLRTRKSGSFRFVEFHLKVDPQMTVLSSHQITEVLSQMIEKQYPGTSVTIHVEPCDGSCTENCLAGCLLPADMRSAIKEQRKS
jgi:cation diffusion facilitator family transporter